MKKLIAIFLLTSLFLSCKTNNSKNRLEVTQDLTSYTFQVKVDNNEDLEIFEDGIIPWISIKNSKSELKNLIGKDNILFKANVVTLIIDYPLTHPTSIDLRPKSSKGFTREDLVMQISAEYNRIYKEEEETAINKTIPIEDRKSLINRNTTDGKYGICGHDIDDLDLSEVVIRISEKGELILELIIES